MPIKTALVVIDAQVAFFGHGDIPSVHDADGMISRIASVVSDARLHAVPIIVVQHDGPAGHPMEPSAPGWELHPTLDVSKETVVRKTRPDAFFQTDLLGKLEVAGASHLIILGNQSEFCIDTTCRRAVSEGHHVTLVSDCHSTWSSDVLTADQIIAHHNLVLGKQFVKLTKAEEIDWTAL